MPPASASLTEISSCQYFELFHTSRTFYAISAKIELEIGAPGRLTQRPTGLGDHMKRNTFSLRIGSLRLNFGKKMKGKKHYIEG